MAIGARAAAISGFFVLSASLLASACASGETTLLSEDPEYARAFGDGCATALEESKSFSTKRVADDEGFENSRAYRAGWRQGYLQCKSNDYDRNDGGRVLGNENDF